MKDQAQQKKEKTAFYCKRVEGNKSINWPGVNFALEKAFFSHNDKQKMKDERMT